MKMHEYKDDFLEEMKVAVLNFMGIDDCKVVFKPHEELNKDCNGHGSGITQNDDAIYFGMYTQYNKTIKLNRNVEILDMLSCFFHEIWHHIQYKTGKLVNARDKYGDLCGFIFDDIHYDEDYPYELRPWEHEADKKQNHLFKEFVNDPNQQAFLFRLLEIHKKG